MENSFIVQVARILDKTEYIAVTSNQVANQMGLIDDADSLEVSRITSKVANAMRRLSDIHLVNISTSPGTRRFLYSKTVPNVSEQYLESIKRKN